MTLLKMMLRLFTSIFGTTHPTAEQEERYAWMLFGLVVVIVAAMAAVAWIVVKVMG